MTSLGDRIQQRRIELGISQHELANGAKTSQRMISMLEAGKIKKTKKIPEIARALSVNPGWLTTGEGEKETIEIDVKGAKKLILKTHTTYSYEVIKDEKK